MKRWKITFSLSMLFTGGSALWLWLLKQYRETQGVDEQTFMMGPGAKWVYIASAGFLFGLFVLFPVSTYFQEKEEGRVGGPVVPDSWRKPTIIILWIAFAFTVLIGLAGLLVTYR